MISVLVCLCLFIFLSICVCLYQPHRTSRCDIRLIFRRSLIGLNSEFSFSYNCYLTMSKELNLPYYLPIAGGRIIGFIPFPLVLVLCEMQSASYRIWTRVVVSIFCDDNHFTTSISLSLSLSVRASIFRSS